MGELIFMFCFALFCGQANSIVIDHVQAESWLHRFIIGRKGKNIDNITSSLSKVRQSINSDWSSSVILPRINSSLKLLYTSHSPPSTSREKRKWKFPLLDCSPNFQIVSLRSAQPCFKEAILREWNYQIASWIQLKMGHNFSLLMCLYIFCCYKLMYIR